jgi:hypothetical protein
MVGYPKLSSNVLYLGRCETINYRIETRFGRTRLLPSRLLAANSTLPLVNVRTWPKVAPQERRSPDTKLIAESKDLCGGWAQALRFRSTGRLAPFR